MNDPKLRMIAVERLLHEISKPIHLYPDTHLEIVCSDTIFHATVVNSNANYFLGTMEYWKINTILFEITSFYYFASNITILQWFRTSLRKSIIRSKLIPSYMHLLKFKRSIHSNVIHSVILSNLFAPLSHDDWKVLTASIRCVSYMCNMYTTNYYMGLDVWSESLKPKIGGTRLFLLGLFVQ